MNAHWIQITVILMILKLTGNQFQLPILNDPIPVWLYAGTLIMSQSQLGLQRLLDSFQQYWTSNTLEINIAKTKVLFF